MFSERARESALRVRRHQSALGATQQPDASGMTPAIAARVKEILAQQAGNGKKKGKAHAKPKANPKAKAAAAAAKKAEREKAAQAKKVEREKAKTERTAASTAKREATQAARAKTKAERVAAQQAKQATAAKKKQTAIAKAKHAQKQAAAKKKQAAHARDEQQQQRTLIQSFRHATKAQDGYAIKQSAEERAMFAAMGESGSLRPQNSKGNRPKSSGHAAGAGGATVSGDSEAHARFVQTKQKVAALQKEQRTLKTKIRQVDAKLKQRPSAKDRLAQLRDKQARLNELGQKLTKGGLTLAETRAIAAQLKQIRAEKALHLEDIAMTDLAIKAGARNARADKAHLDTAALHLHAAGAVCPDCAPEDEADDDDATKAIKGIMDDPGYYAQHECGDIMQASSGLQTLAMLIQSELGEDDEDDAQIQKLCDAAETLITFMQGELDELRGAAKDDADGKTAGDVPMAKAVSRAIAGFNETFLESHIAGGAIKAIGDNDEIGGYAVLFGDADAPDIERDYYTKSTNFWLDDFGWPRPITYHHGMDAGTRDDPVIGHWTKAAVDDTGVWLSGQLNRAHAYYKAIKELAARGYLKLSSDSAPQWVQREKQANGANFVKRWPLITASTTVTPMEPRMLPVEVKAYLAELGYSDIDDSPEAVTSESVRRDGVKTDDERTRRLILELDILELETAA